MADSATGGYLVPNLSPAPQQGQSFQDFIHDVIAGVTGLNGAYVRPAWQAEPANIPANIDWCAFRLVSFVAEKGTPYFGPSDGAKQTMLRHEEVRIETSFYGNNADQYASFLRDGLFVPQNREVLFANAMNLVDTGDVIPAPSLIKEKWLYRADISFTIRREIIRSYPVLSILSSAGTITAAGEIGVVTETFNVPS